MSDARKAPLFTSIVYTEVLKHSSDRSLICTLRESLHLPGCMFTWGETSSSLLHHLYELAHRRSRGSGYWILPCLEGYHSNESVLHFWEVVLWSIQWLAELHSPPTCPQPLIWTSSWPTLNWLCINLHIFFSPALSPISLAFCFLHPLSCLIPLLCWDISPKPRCMGSISVSFPERNTSRGKGFYYSK